MSERLAAQLRFLAELDRAKTVLRHNHVTGTDRREDDAQHQWHVAVMALFLAEYSEEEVDVPKVVAMLLLHDVVEIDAGDVFAYDEIGRAGKRERELAAADRIYRLLPDDQAAWARALWEEFEEGASADARFARALDRLQVLLQNVATGGAAWRRYGTTVDRVRDRNAAIGEASTLLWDHARGVIESAARAGMLNDRSPQSRR